MSFKTSPNRIFVTEANGHVTLDTNEPMPHILQVAQVNASCGYPNCTSTAAHAHWDHSYPDNWTECGTETECGFENVCGPETQCGFKNVCAWGYQGGVYGYYCSSQYVCEQVQVCHNTWVCKPVFACRQKQGTRIETHCNSQTVYLAGTEWVQDQNLLALTHADADFVQVKVYASRTAAGTDPRYGTFQAVLPEGWLLAQGSTLLESSFLAGGSSWLRRIMSIVVEGGYVKVRFKQSTRANSAGMQGNGLVHTRYEPFGHPTAPMTLPDPDRVHSSIASSFSFTFDITVGKFTK